MWQDFILSSSGLESVPAADASFVADMAREARELVPQKRHHPSLAFWCGGNELASAEGPLDESAPVLGALRDVVRELDPGRGWLPTSPSGPSSLNRLDLIAADPEGQHDVHGPWEHGGLERHYELYNAGTSLLHSEFGVEGMTNRRALEALIAPSRRWPADRTNPVYEHLGAWWNNAPFVRAAFGGRLDGLDTLRRASQLLQYDGLRYAVEASRRRAFRSSGAIPWQFNESFPNAWCTAAVDYFGDAKPAYYGVRRAYRDRHVCASFDRVAWGGRERFRATVWAWGGTPAADVSARVVDAFGGVAGERLWRARELGATPALIGDVEADLRSLATDVFFLDLWLGDVGNRYLMSRTSDLSPLLDLEPAELTLEVDRATDTWSLLLRHVAGAAAPALVLEDARAPGAPGWALFADNVVDLLPGESRQVDVTWRDADEAGRALAIEGWNAERLHAG